MAKAVTNETHSAAPSASGMAKPPASHDNGEGSSDSNPGSSKERRIPAGAGNQSTGEGGQAVNRIGEEASAASPQIPARQGRNTLRSWQAEEFVPEYSSRMARDLKPWF